ncbi:MAG: LysR family transcriptional regulator [Bacteriovoracaceae bacterium]|nr:LysR family transcriptional regulator [Bacteriovoracaceae bacterium]
MKYESSHLQVLIALMQSDSISRAADSLGVTQSAVSQTLKTLEGKVGFPLLARHGKNVTLTEDGRKLAKIAKQYLKRIEDTIDQIHQEAKVVSGSLHVGTLAGLGKSWITSRIIDFLSEHPDLEVKVSMDFPENLIRRFERGDINCLILPDYQVPAWASSWVLHEEHTVLVFPDSKEFKINDKSDLKDILQFPVIMFEENDPLFFRWCKEHFGALPRQVKSRLMVNSFGKILQAVYDGLGVAVVPTHVLERSFYKDKIKTLKGSEVFNNTICFATRVEEADGLKMKGLYQHLLSTSKSFGKK